MTASNRAILGLLAGLAFLAGACGKGGEKPSDVAGGVTYDGAQVQAGTVSFEPTTATAPPSTLTINQGKYATARVGLKPGKYLVRITAPDLSKMNANAANDPHVQVPFVPLLPDSWNVRSKLTVELKPGRNALHFRGKKGEAPQSEIGN